MEESKFEWSSDEEDYTEDHYPAGWLFPDTTSKRYAVYLSHFDEYKDVLGPDGLAYEFPDWFLDSVGAMY